MSLKFGIFLVVALLGTISFSGSTPTGMLGDVELEAANETTTAANSTEAANITTSPLTTPESNMTTPESNMTTPESNVTTPMSNMTTSESNMTTPMANTTTEMTTMMTTTNGSGTTMSTTTTTEKAGRKFDGASFGGGIALGVGVVAIMGVALYCLKCRKSGYDTLEK